MGRWPGSWVLKETYTWGKCQASYIQHEAKSLRPPRTGPHQTSWFLMVSSQNLPTCYLYSLVACPDFGPAELGPDTPTSSGTGTRPCPPRSLVPARTQPTQSYRLGQPGELTFPFHSRHNGGSCLPPTTFSLSTSCHTPLLPTSAHRHGSILLFGMTLLPS